MVVWKCLVSINKSLNWWLSFFVIWNFPAFNLKFMYIIETLVLYRLCTPYTYSPCKSDKAPTNSKIHAYNNQSWVHTLVEFQIYTWLTITFNCCGKPMVLWMFSLTGKNSKYFAIVSLCNVSRLGAILSILLKHHCSWL